MTMGKKGKGTLLVLGLLSLVGCLESEEAKRVEIAVEVLPSLSAPVMSSSGFEVNITEASVVFRDFEFTIKGEEHASLWDLLIPSAFAHPGHYSGGQVTGELPGAFEVDLLVGRELGMASLIVGTYEGANLSFGTLAEASGSLRIAGVATRDQDVVEFELDVEMEPTFQVIGIPFAAEIREKEDRTIYLRVLDHDGITGIFDGLDLESRIGVEGSVILEESDVNRVRRRFLGHAFYSLEAR